MNTSVAIQFAEIRSGRAFSVVHNGLALLGFVVLAAAVFYGGRLAGNSASDALDVRAMVFGQIRYAAGGTAEVPGDSEAENQQHRALASSIERDESSHRQAPRHTRPRPVEWYAIVVRDRAGFPGALDRVLSQMGVRGFNVVFDAVSGPYFQPAYTRLLPEGRYVVYGAADFMTRGTRRNWWHLARAYLSRPRVDPLHMVSDNRSVMGFNLIWLWDKAPELSGLFDAMAPVFTAPPHVGRTFSFGDAPAAMRYLQGGGSVGKVVLESGVK